MKTFTLAAIVALLVLALWSGCRTTPPASVTYLGDTNELSTLTAPNNFIVSPAEADNIRVLRNGRSIAVHHIYYDDDSYYICDGFLGSKERTAISRGLRIDGKTGETYNRETGSKEPRPK